MPAYVYSHIKDPETGVEICVPQLFPYASHTGEILPEELENWVKTGVIPEEIYETHIDDIRKGHEIHERLKNGEEVLTSDLPSKPWALTDFMLKNKARLYGENVLLKIFSHVNGNDQDIVWLSFVKEAITCLASQDPLPIHFLVARKVLKDKFSLDESKPRDLLARELVENCHKILKFQIFQHKAFSKNPIDIEDLHDHLKDDKTQILKLDAEFITYLKSIGKSGKKVAEDIEQASLEIYQYYEKQGYPPQERGKVWGFWTPHNNEPTNLALEFLAEVLWEDKCSRLWQREASGHPAVARPIIDKMIVVAGSHKNKKFVEKEGEIICYDRSGDPILTAPAVDPNMISLFKEGVRGLSSLTGHKMLRWQVNAGFERWASGETDPRLIKIDGGYSKIAELIRCANKRDIATVREILHAQAHGYFTFPDGSRGNMITLRIEERHKNQEPSKIHIVLGDMLLPEYVCQLKRSDKLLVPIGDLPPLHGSPNSHASQAQLQLLVFQEFSNQSDRLAQEGSVLISNEQWKRLAYEAGISPEKIEIVISHWCQPDLFNCFLEKQGDEYRLASYYHRAQKFLEGQGKRRITNSERGKRGIEQKSKPRKT